jgi:acetoin utilization deacetylase AcuC-like enzyme
LPKLRDFSADLLIFSSGFDAHYDDLYHFLTEDDFHWLTREIIDACSGSSSAAGGGAGSVTHPSRVVSILEGGYSLSAPVPSLPTKKSGLKKGKRH